MTRSLRHRHTRRRIWWWAEPIVSPYADRLRTAALGDHMCQPILVLPDGTVQAARWAPHP